ncbi:MAG: molybdate ABC transporter substrate-binding protein [Paracoccus sp. (in: a-proteobacteria)]|uniref:molybdate ABC transporter substrate-binding protein n=1 Tax=Paracoccus sp. TaxID=267 RepID=UPI00391D0299
MMPPVPRRLILAAALSLFGQSLAAVAAPEAPVIAAAADLQFAVTEIAEAFTAETGMTLRLSFGSTGNFARQIREGAPFQIFMAADEAFVSDLHADGFTVDGGDLYALGRIVVMAPHGSALRPDPQMEGLARMLAAGQIARFAIANPDHAPYGARAREALITRGLWQDIQPVLVMGENVAQAAQFALSGNAAGGIIAYSLALAPPVAARGEFALIPADWHAPLRQRMVLLNGAGEVAQAFYAYLQGPAARDTLQRYGFELPVGG